MEPQLWFRDLLVKDRFPLWMFWSRPVQVILSVVVLGLDAFVVREWNKNDFSNMMAPVVEATFGNTNFKGFVMFVVIITLIIILYDLIAPYKASNFYHVYTETALEFLLTVFWLVSFAGVSAYVSSFDPTLSAYYSVLNYMGNLGGDVDAHNKAASACFKAIAVLGAFMFVLCLANFVFLAVFLIRSRRDQKAIDTPAAQTKETTLGDADVRVENGLELPEMKQAP